MSNINHRLARSLVLLAAAVALLALAACGTQVSVAPGALSSGSRFGDSWGGRGAGSRA